MRPHIPDKLAERVESVAEEEGYQTGSEFVRAAVRRLLERYQDGLAFGSGYQDRVVLNPTVREVPVEPMCPDCETVIKQLRGDDGSVEYWCQCPEKRRFEIPNGNSGGGRGGRLTPDDIEFESGADA